MHGIGVHPDWDLINTLRSALVDHGYTTLSVQMPVLAAEASTEDYRSTFDEAAERLSVSHLLHLAFFTELYDSRGQPYLVNSTMQSRTCIQLAVLPQGAESRSCAWQR